LALNLKIPFFLAGVRATEELKADISVAYSQVRLLLQMLILQCQLLFQNQSLEQLEEKVQPLLHPC
jgi:hypothetical protein